MRDTASLPLKRQGRRAWLAAAAIPTTVALGLSMAPVATAQSSLGSSSFSDGIRPSDPVERTPIDTEYPTVENLPAGVEVERVEWISDRRLAIFIKSAAMPDELVQVQMLLARDWHSSPDRNFPEVWALDGLRARDDESGWTIETNIEQFYADKNVNVILPVGGEASFYSDWQEPDNGTHYKWETFLMQELIPILDNGFRSNQQRAVFGLSMGGTAAMNLAQRYPSFFEFVGSFSGYLDTTSTGMPLAIEAAQADAGGYNSEAMWGPLGSQDWVDHDPKRGISELKDMTVYVSAGSGVDDFGDPESVATDVANSAGIGLEVLSRMTTSTFMSYAKAAGVEPISFFRPSGVHAWPYWQFEMTQAWPYIANAFGLSTEDRGADCTTEGAIAAAVSGQTTIGSCVNNEYPVGDDGMRQDFRNGTAYWSPDTGAHTLFGAINARYNALEGPAGWLGFPTSGELIAPDGVGRYVKFENGSIYWSPSTGAWEIPNDMIDSWGTAGFETGDLGYPTAGAASVNGGLVQQFQGGYVIRTPEDGVHWVRGLIGQKYGEMGTVNSELGFPTSNEYLISGGAFQRFENGNIYWSPSTGAHFIKYGAIFDAWGEADWEQGELGFPTADQTSIPAGGEVVEFENGTLSEINGSIEKS
ncbi:alpha/beta hydrolase-fold protein [Corynebacterium alimapuense]|uniref:Acyl-CoA:diacylglycerol acyltransferase n=1 Tax=Corynebacterium alimapuense TaxID=1576874 RepID=A0A3M8KBU1_9CORY|nr:alpha/beta hydrolase-fold protein [Corynebacterium alimapuense]RNE49992.1 hypothetical protein C5L39_01050 [Corynebacterium alimapuense]